MVEIIRFSEHLIFWQARYTVIQIFVKVGYLLLIHYYNTQTMNSLLHISLSN